MIALPCQYQRQRSRGGFSLLEIILSLAIFVGSVAVLSQLIGMGMDLSDMATNTAEGMIVIESRWGELKGGLIPLQNGMTPSSEILGWESSMTSQSSSMPYVYQVTISAQKTGRPSTKISLTRLWYDELTAAEATSEESTSAQ